MKKKNMLAFIIIAIIAFAGIFATISSTNSGDGTAVMSEEKASKQLARYLKSIDVTKKTARKANVELEETDLKEELPDISKYPLAVEGKADIVIEIFSSPEKAGEGSDSWLSTMAKEFNKQKNKIDGKTVAISVRSMASGLGADYIVSGKYRPDAFTPSNDLWGKIIEAEGADISVVRERMVGNVAGVLLTKSVVKDITENYGEVTMKTITQATADNKIAMGYTNPLSSSAGMNFLLSTLNAYDSADILSDTAIEGFQQFQVNVPFVAYTTLQMRESAKSGSLTGMVIEYQLYKNDSDLRSQYEFVPYGVRHDNPLYEIGKLSADKKEALELFVSYCESEESQKLATKYGFNGMEDYKSDLSEYDGSTILSAQKLWKENKDSGKSITAVFVADVSGSMSGEPLNQLKTSLINGSKYINSENSIGLVSYDSKVYLNLPIAKFDLNQRSLFTGAVQDLQEGGATASFDALAVALNMLLEEKEKNPDTKLMIFLLSDGETNSGLSLKNISGVLKAYKIPVYTIGYNADIDALETISAINEAASINADSDDVVYKLKNLFNAQM
ncbi:vWA domain-containing protein [Anaerosporobacter sp.]|uniref:vWA domain-containing protein n=1 Tax=Anaerosporobacter sp. TaxID=1872529 RepID=UPI00286F326E|nr:VWA domain-containing protein [Anaerosporobacter sp.]